MLVIINRKTCFIRQAKHPKKKKQLGTYVTRLAIHLLFVILIYLILFCMTSSSLIRQEGQHKPILISSGYIPFSSISIPYSIHQLCGSIVPNQTSNFSIHSRRIQYRLY
jgi:hypothetical protein